VQVNDGRRKRPAAVVVALDRKDAGALSQPCGFENHEVGDIAGGAFVLYLAWDSFRPARVDPEAPAEPPRSWFKGIVTNLLSPHPWLFWLTVGAAILAKAIAQSWLVAAAFLCGFYLLLVGSKVLVALMAGRSRDLLAGRPYRVVMRVLAVLLGVFAILLFREGLRLLAVV